MSNNLPAVQKASVVEAEGPLADFQVLVERLNNTVQDLNAIENMMHELEHGSVRYKLSDHGDELEEVTQKMRVTLDKWKGGYYQPKTLGQLLRQKQLEEQDRTVVDDQ